MSGNKFFIGLGGLIALVMIVFFSVFNVKFIDAGYTGVKIKLYGNTKGVTDVSAVTGMCIYNRWTTRVIKTPTYNHTTKWTFDKTEGSKNNQEFVLTTKDGLPVKMDVALIWRVLGKDAASMYVNYRKPYDEVADEVLRSLVRTAYNSACAQFTAEELFTRRLDFEHIADSLTKCELIKEGFTINKSMVLKDIRPPASIMEGIELKVTAEQTALRKEMEQEQETADAEKLRINAEGAAAAKRITADAERYEYEQKQVALTPLLIQQQYLDRWDGTYGTGNVFGAGAMMYKQVGK